MGLFGKKRETEGKQAAEWLNEGVALGDLERYEEEIKCYDKALEIDPRYTKAWYNKGAALSNLKRYEEAIRCYDKALEIDPRHAGAWYNKGAALSNLKRYEEEIKCYDKALEIDPRHAKAWYQKGLALMNLERYDEAISCYDKSLEIGPRHAKAWYQKGLALMNLERYDEAISCYDKSLEIDPRHAKAWCSKGLALMDLDEYDEAFECYDEALKIDPNDAEAWFNKGIDLDCLERYDEAIRCYDKAMEIKPSDAAAALYNKGTALMNLERYDEAISCYDKSLEIDPRDAHTWYQKGLALMNLERHDEAIRCWDKASVIGPMDAFHWWVMKGLELSDIKRYREVIECYDKALGIDPSDAAAWCNKGAALINLERYDEAIRCYDKALEIEPNWERAEKERQLAVEKSKTQRMRKTEEGGEPKAPVEAVPGHRPASFFPPELDESYYDASFIGSGGFAQVFRAKRKTDGQEVAVKVPIALDTTTGRSFVREITSWQRLSHRNIVKLYDLNILPIPYLEMELCQGSLDDLPKLLGTEQAASLMFQVAEGLKHAHAQGIIHRDLKPQNILLQGDTPKISDWGLSKIASESKSSSVRGFSPVYAAPEQISPQKFGRPDYRTDIYQLGAVFYELVTAEPPCTGDDLTELMGQILMVEPKAPSLLNSEAGGVEPIIMKCLQKEMKERYQSVAEMQQALAQYLKVEYKDSLRESQGNIRRSGYYCCALCQVHLMVGDLANALKYAQDLDHYASGETKAELANLISELEHRSKENMGISEELVERAAIVLHQVKMGR